MNPNVFLLLVAFWCSFQASDLSKATAAFSHVKVSHNSPCLRSVECRSAVSNSFCEQSENEATCQCRAGFIANEQGTACLFLPDKVQQCSLPHLNSAMLPSDDCGVNQFCRQNLCLCLLNYRFDSHQGVCVPDDAAEKADLQLQINVLAVRLEAQNGKVKQEFLKWATFALKGVGLLLTAILILVRSLKRNVAVTIDSEETAPLEQIP